jgi:carbonic anhydrase
MKNGIRVLSLVLLLTGCQQQEKRSQPEAAAPARPAPSADVVTREKQQALTPAQVLEELKAGNERFVRGKLTQRDYLAQVKATAGGQYPKAIVLSCLDSRVPVETVFDQGIGDIFVGRVAGNIADTDMLGSFEFGAAVSGAKLIVVVGHTECGAVKGAIDREGVKELGLKNLDALLVAIDPAVKRSLRPGEERSSKNKDLLERVTRENVLETIAQLRAKSPSLKKMEEDGKIQIVGGIYDVHTGKVTWL